MCFREAPLLILFIFRNKLVGALFDLEMLERGGGDEGGGERFILSDIYWTDE